ncbi:MAG: Hsp20/alpha crystallin family protein [Saprospiraceae bacterium]|nr:Hsp20/alpha crystallin family protein [Saprospiraceae bacterium]
MNLIKRNEELFPGLWNDFFDDNWFGVPNIARAGTSVPAVNIKDTEKSYEIEMAAPGMKKENFKVDLDKNMLSISSEQQSEETDKAKDGNYTRREFSYHSFKRAFTLPDIAEFEKISASYKDGILHISIPKKEEALPKPIKVIEIS